MIQTAVMDTTQTAKLLERVLSPMTALSPWERIAFVLVFSVLGHLFVRALKAGTQRLLSSKHDAKDDREVDLQSRYPKLATLISLVSSGLIFLVYFAALGLMLDEANVRITTYLASASVIGLAVGFGAQGLVQDVMTGLTLIFSDYLRIGDMVEISGQTGTVEQVGLRFTRLTNFMGARVVIPNRNISQMSRFRSDVVRVYVDTRVPSSLDPDIVAEIVSAQARGLREQFAATIVTDPEVSPPVDAGAGAWRFVRVKFRIWPGQQTLITDTFKPALADALRERAPDFKDWQISVTHRVD